MQEVEPRKLKRVCLRAWAEVDTSKETGAASLVLIG